MKKKHQPIPDFSGKRKDAGMRVQPSQQQKSQAQPNTPPRVTKPAATSSKSGRRGG